MYLPTLPVDEPGPMTSLYRYFTVSESRQKTGSDNFRGNPLNILSLLRNVVFLRIPASSLGLIVPVLLAGQTANLRFIYQ